MHALRPTAPTIVLAGIVAFAIGLVLGKDQGDAETLRNTMSAVLLTVGFLAVVGGLIAVAVGRVRRRA